MIVRDDLTAFEHAVSGPQLYFLGAHEAIVPGDDDELRAKVVLEKNAFAHVRDEKTGEQWSVRGPATVVLQPSESMGRVQKATKLEETQYLVVTDKLSGAQRVVLGPTLFFPGVYETASDAREKLSLKRHEFAKILDETSGEIRVVAGPAVVVPSPTELVLNGKRAAFELQAHQYA